MQWIDFVILALLATTIYCGWRKGFIVTAIELFKWIASLVMARIFYQPFTHYVLKNIFDPTERISKHVRNYLYDFFNYDPMVGQTMTLEQSHDALASLSLPEQFITSVKETIGQEMIHQTIDFVDVLTSRITEMVVLGIGFVLLLVMFLIGFGILQWMGSLISKLPVFKELNQGGGLIMGAILGVIVVYALMAVLSFFPTFKWTENMIQTIENSQIAIYFYKYNILKYALKSVLMQGFI